MFLIASKNLLPKGYRGMTIFPFVILRDKNDITDLALINHEKIHIRQQIELLILPFFIWYAVAFAVGLLKYRSKTLAYRNIIFEREAYIKEKDPDYLKKRPLWNFVRF